LLKKHGFSFTVGVACRASYGVSWLYVMSDVAIEARQQYMATKGSDMTGLARTVTERTLFQTFASMAIPAFMIHTAVHKSQHVCYVVLCCPGLLVGASTPCSSLYGHG
jgi:hypothetical protein